MKSDPSLSHAVGVAPRPSAKPKTVRPCPRQREDTSGQAGGSGATMKANEKKRG